jgi:hypothetical protein
MLGRCNRTSSGEKSLECGIGLSALILAAAHFHVGYTKNQNKGGKTGSKFFLLKMRQKVIE